MDKFTSIKIAIYSLPIAITHREALLKYYMRDASTSDFIITLMENDLRKFCSKYSPYLVDALIIIQFVEREFPKDSWGSVMNVSYWLANND